MWYLISGKLMSFIAYFSFKNLFDLNNNYLNTAVKFFGWFLLEHIEEDYEKTAGKFFITNEDFRRLIKNIFIVVRNVIFWSHLITFLEFILILSILILLIYVLFHFLKVKRIKSILLDCVLLFYYLNIILFLSLNLYFSFDWFDLCFIFNPIIIILLMLGFIKLKVLVYFYDYIINNQNKIIFIKFLLYLILLYIIIISFDLNLIKNNFIQESVVKILIIYSYVYCFKF